MHIMKTSEVILHELQPYIFVILQKNKISIENSP